jgi:ribonuclease E
VSKEIIVSESEKIAVVLENGVVREFFLSEGEQYVGDIILATVESIVPAIEAAFLNIGREKSGFIHVSDLPASRKQQSGIRQFVKPQQQMLVQVTREPTGNKGAGLSGFIQLPGRFLVLTPFERRIGLSKRIFDARERTRLARIARIICGSGYGIVLRPEAIGQSEQTLRDDLKLLISRWKQILEQSDKQSAGTTLYRDQDVLERILREGSTQSVSRIIVDSEATYDRASKYFNNWSDTKTQSKLRIYNGETPVLSHFGIQQQLEHAIQPLVQLPSGGTLVIQPTEALTSIDINTSSMTSTDNQPETILRTNCEAAEEVARQLILRDIGGVIVIDFIDMDNPRDQQIVWQKLADALHTDKAQPQISYFSDFGLVQMTRRRQRQRLSEMLTMSCPTCQGIGRIRNLLYRSDILTPQGMRTRLPLIQPEDKSVRYRGGTEKQPARPVPSKPVRQNPPQRIPEESPVVAEAPRQKSAPPPMKPMPIEKEDTFETRSDNSRNKKSPVKLEETVNDLAFDDALFNAEVSEATLESYIEREDNLNVSSRLATVLDELLEQVEEEGLSSIKRQLEAPGRSEYKHPSDKEGDDDTETEEDSETELDNTNSEDEFATEETVVEKKPAKKTSRGRKKKAAVKKSEAEVTPVSDEDNASSDDEEQKEEKSSRSKKTVKKTVKKADIEPASDDEVSEAEVSEPEIPHYVEPGNEADGPEEDIPEVNGNDARIPEKPSVSSLAESALTSSSSQTKPTKRAVMRRRTIRSFRPKR